MSNEPRAIRVDNDADVSLSSNEVADSLLEQLPDDERLGSGVPPEQRASDLDFIQMTGLTRSQRPRGHAPETPVSRDDLDPQRPVSFYEQGVEDVDASMAPGSMETLGRESEDILAARRDSPSIAQLKGIIADLSSEKGSTPRDREHTPLEIPAAHKPLIEGNDIGDSEPRAGTQDETEEIIIDTEEVVVEDPSPAPWPSSSPDLPPLQADPEHLREAEQLLDELQRQPREATYNLEDEREELPQPTDGPTAGVVLPGPVEKDASIYERPLRPHARRRSRSAKDRVSRRLVRWGVRAVVAAAVCGAIAVLYMYIAPLLSAPDETLSRAEALARKGQYERASEAYQAFARLHPLHTDRPRAQFESALILLQAKADAADKERRLHEKALGLFEAFIQDNPDHTWEVRARSLIGVLYCRLGAYEKAIEALRELDVRLADPDAALPAMRTLARAYAHTGDYEAAESLYLQAASLADNYDADTDYYELGELYRKRAEGAPDAKEKAALRTTAVDYWTHAVRVPGIDPLAKARIMDRCDWLAAQGVMTAADTSSPAAEDEVPVRPEPVTRANVDTPIPEPIEDLESALPELTAEEKSTASESQSP